MCAHMSCVAFFASNALGFWSLVTYLKQCKIEELTICLSTSSLNMVTPLTGVVSPKEHPITLCK